MKIDDLKLLGKDLTIKRKDGSFLRGYCLNQFSDRIIINPKGSDDRVVVLNVDDILDITFEDFKSVKTFKEMKG